MGAAVEAEALDQRILIPLIVDALDDLLPVELDEVGARERRQREELTTTLHEATEE